jgi:hypothetical protein
MYDFAREVEPVLEVLVGKALEIARFELLEEHETEKLHKNKGLFKQTKESMLMQVQRLEGQRSRFN